MNIKECIEKAVKILNEKYSDIKISNIESNVLLCYTLDITKVDIINKAYDKVENNKLDHFLSLIKRRLSNEPIAYIINKKEFYGREYFVDSSVLIPRPETEELVDLALKYIKTKDRIIDIGTGSGIIAITIKDILKDIDVHAIDISSSAINIARTNSVNILGEESINFINTDSINYIPNIKYDILISNPPYISLKYKDTLAKDLSYEPSIALFGGETGFEFYDIFIPIVRRYIKHGGVFIFEIGYEQGDYLIELCSKNNIENVYIKKDLSGNDRFLICESV